MDVRGIINKIKNKIMGLLDKKRKKQSQINDQKLKEQQIQQREQENLRILRTKLDSNELQYLIGLIARSDFKGTDLQMIFSITAKLQNQLND